MVHVNLVEKYLFAAGLEGLERKTDRYNARCQICGDSEKSKRLKRFWVLFDDQKCTSAQLSKAVKNTISHRAQALLQLLPQLTAQLNQSEQSNG